LRGTTSNVGFENTAAGTTLPNQIDLRPNFAFYPPQDQGDLNSCTSFAIAGAIAYLANKKNKMVVSPSELFIYYNERVLQGVIDENSPVEIKNGLIATSKSGSCHTDFWPYDQGKYKVKPPEPAYENAKKILTATYEFVEQDEAHIKESIANDIPVLFGMSVYPYFISKKMADSGVLTMPIPNDFRMGGHAPLLVGYNDGTRQFIARNSFGTDWGMDGYFTLPYDYVLNPNYGTDFWRISELKTDIS